MGDMSLGVPILLLPVLPLLSVLGRSAIEEHFVQSLNQQDLLFYFDTTSNTSVPEFQVVWPDCLPAELSVKPWQCTIEAQGKRYELGRGNAGLPSCSSPRVRLLNSSLITSRTRLGSCCEQVTILRPHAGRAALTLCGGALDGLVLVKGTWLYIQSVLPRHQHLVKPISRAPNLAHLVFHRPLLVGTSLGTGSGHRSHTGVRLRRRSAVPPEVRHLELLVVVGPDVQQVHREDTERYVLTNLNIASELLRDVSLGANMRVHLVRMIILTEPKSEVRISENITDSLLSVCDWGRKINPANDMDPLHADLLLYITRFDLELPDGNKQVRGVAQLGGACSSRWSCVITEDTGFDLGITIAHEIGHSFGINHDGTGNACSSGGFIMASDGGYNSVDLSWSQCSRDQLQSYFSAGNAECVRDLPILGGTLQDWKPGLYYGVDDQCRIAFGRTATACSFTTGDVDACRVLSCHVIPGDQSSCTRLLIPLLDGTECAPNQWCLKGRCVSPSQLTSSIAVHGSWSSWTEFSSCSRTCGGGVSSRKRQCNNPRPAFGGSNCPGHDTEAELCNREPCAEVQLEFMEQQCSQTDHQPLYLSPSSASLYHWVSSVGFITGDLQCKLMCRSQGEDFMVSRGSQFIDGTRCEPDSTAPPGSISACLVGRCKVFGCDGLLGSRKKEDACGVCGGNGTSCSLVSGYYREGRAKEYVTFLTLPQNATRVYIANTSPLFTHLGVYIRGTYVLAGRGSIALNTTHPSLIEDRRLVYRLHLTSDLLPHKEELQFDGPLPEEVHIQVYRKYGREYGEATSPNISYSFYTPGSTSPVKAKWKVQTTHCSVTCGLGVQQMVSICVDEQSQQHLGDSLCTLTSPSPPLQTVCQRPACPPHWETGEFGPCSASCGGGEMLRTVTCVQRQEAELVDRPPYECVPESRPGHVSSCNLQPCPARWHVSEGGNCSAVCGPGVVQRTVSCIRTENGSDVEVNEGLCPTSERPADTLPCVVDVCPIGWENGDELRPKAALLVMTPIHAESVHVWSPVMGQCSKSCGMGQQQVWYTCVDHQTRQQVLEVYCDESSKPKAFWELCNSGACPPMWRYHQGSCSVTCGGGMARRVLYCCRDTELGEEIVPDSECSLPRPATLVPCSSEPCPARWQVQEPGTCSVSCGTGVAQRRVSCVRFQQGADREVEEELCHTERRPSHTEPCMVTVCTFSWEVQEWSQCSVTCGNGIQSRAVNCLGPGHSLPLSPQLCMHLPKPITIQACHADDCVHHHTPTQPSILGTSTHPSVEPTVQIPHSRQRPVPPEPTMPVVPDLTTQATVTSLCGMLLLKDSGTVNLTNVVERDCLLTIGRPLDEVIHVRVNYSSLDCKRREIVVFYDRRILMRRCERLSGFSFTTHTNVLLVRQGLMSPGRGVLLTYSSQKSTKKGLYTACDVQLFGSAGEITNPTLEPDSEGHTCRVFINAPPSTQVEIRALSMQPTLTGSPVQPTYILIRDVKVTKTTVFLGNQLFLWRSSGSMVEIEFYGGYLQHKGSFRGEFSAI